MLELKVAAVQSFALLINNFHEPQSTAQTNGGERGEHAQARAECAGKQIKY